MRSRVRLRRPGLTAGGQGGAARGLGMYHLADELEVAKELLSVELPVV